MERLAIARKALAAAELRAGLRVVRADSAQSATVSGEVSEDIFHVPSFLAGALPNGIIRRGVIRVWGSPFLLILLSAVASRQGAWVAFLGTPDVGWACAQKLGMDMRRVVSVPRVGEQGPRVVSAAIDGFDVVVLGDISLDVRQCRVLRQRALSAGTLLLAARWPQACLDIECQPRNIHGLEQSGYITAIDYRIITRWGQSEVRYGRDGWSALTRALSVVDVPDVTGVPGEGKRPAVPVRLRGGRAS